MGTLLCFIGGSLIGFNLSGIGKDPSANFLGLIGFGLILIGFAIP